MVGTDGGAGEATGNGDVRIERERVDDPRNANDEPKLEDAARRVTETRHSDSPTGTQFQDIYTPPGTPPGRVRFDDILMPGVAAPHDERHPTPDRAEATTRPQPTDASIPAPKMRRLDPDDMSGDDADSTRSMDMLEERTIIGALLSGVDITEVYSPERVAKLCREYKLISRNSMDFTNGYDFTLEADRQEGMETHN